MGKTGRIFLHCVGCLDVVYMNGMVFLLDLLALIIEVQELKLGLPPRLIQDALKGTEII